MNSILQRVAARLDSHTLSTFAIGGAGAFIVRIAGAGATLLFYLALARIAGEVEYGRYVYVYNWAAILTMIATLGLDAASLRFVAEWPPGRQDRRRRAGRRARRSGV